MEITPAPPVHACKHQAQSLANNQGHSWGTQHEKQSRQMGKRVTGEILYDCSKKGQLLQECTKGKRNVHHFPVERRGREMRRGAQIELEMCFRVFSWSTQLFEGKCCALAKQMKKRHLRQRPACASSWTAADPSDEASQLICTRPSDMSAIFAKAVGDRSMEPTVQGGHYRPRLTSH